MDFSFFFILRFLQDTVVEEWTILVIERERQKKTDTERWSFSENVMQ